MICHLEWRLFVIGSRDIAIMLWIVIFSVLALFLFILTILLWKFEKLDDEF